MTHATPSRSSLLVLVALYLLPGVAMAQSTPPVDPWQFPALANSKAFQRAWWLFQQRAYPLGYIPDGARLRALQQIQQSKAGPGPLVVGGNAWVNIGPAPILNGQVGATLARR